MALILNIETSTTVCSVSLFDKDNLLSSKEINEGYTHSENLHVFVEEVLKEGGKKFTDLNAVAVSKGPGSYTGLRIGTSAAKGFAYTLNIPLISVDTLQLMAYAVSLNTNVRFYCPMIDARRMEVYTAIYDSQLNLVSPVEARIIDLQSIEVFKSFPGICFFGNGMQKCREILAQVPGCNFIEDIHPSARNMGVLAYQKFINKDFEDTAYFEPFYLKEFLAGKKKQK